MANEELLRSKAAEVQRALTVWAQESGALEPGEELVFSLRVRAVPMVTRDESDTPPGGPEVLVRRTHTQYAGTFVKPAQPSDAEVRKILALLTPQAQSQMRRLLVENGNNPTRVYSSSRQQLNKKLEGRRINGKFYRVVSNNNLSQLWEVRPSTPAR